MVWHKCNEKNGVEIYVADYVDLNFTGQATVRCNYAIQVCISVPTTADVDLFC